MKAMLTLLAMLGLLLIGGAILEIVVGAYILGALHLLTGICCLINFLMLGDFI